MDLGDCRIRRGLIALSIATIGCGAGDRKAADLQLDILDAPLVDTDWIRVCIEDTLVYETPIGDGRIAIPGLSGDGPFQVTVNAIVAEEKIGHTETVSLSDDRPWASTIWRSCVEDCVACSIEKPAAQEGGENTRLMAVQFIE